MTQARFQVFVSSTFRDLREERQSVLDATLEMSHFPAGMEMFPASDATPWAIIERVIRDSDFYILIVGGMYGSTDASGISYTEREYDYAVREKKPILAFLHRSPEMIPAGKSEMSTRARNQLKKFRRKVEKHHCKYWNSTEELKCQVVISLNSAIAATPAIGWTRADGIDNPELLKRLADLQEKLDQVSDENRELKKQIDVLSLSSIGGMSSGDDEVELNFEYRHAKTENVPQSVVLTWNQVFYAVAKHLTAPVVETVVRRHFGELIRESFEFNLSNADTSRLSVTVTDSSFEKVRLQFLALELIEIATVMRSTSVIRNRVRKTPEPRETPAWRLTKKGVRYLVLKEAIRR